MLRDGSASTGGAIDDIYGYGRLAVSDCDFNGNVASLEGGAIACNSGLSVEQCSFYYNSADGLASGDNGGNTGLPAYGGAIWAKGCTTYVETSVFYENYIVVGADANGNGCGAAGGAIAWQPGSQTSGLAVVITGSTFSHNGVLGGNSAGGTGNGGVGGGGAVYLDAGTEDAMLTEVLNNRFIGNSAAGGAGYNAGGADGGSLLFDADASSNFSLYANYNMFEGGGAYGGPSERSHSLGRPTAGVARPMVVRLTFSPTPQKTPRLTWISTGSGSPRHEAARHWRMDTAASRMPWAASRGGRGLP